MLTLVAILCVVVVVATICWPSDNSPASHAALAALAVAPAVPVTPLAPAAPVAEPRCEATWKVAEKLLALAEEIAGRFAAVPNWLERREERLQDLYVLLRAGLKQTSLELYTPNNKILVRYAFNLSPDGPARFDLAGDVELPLIENAQFMGARLRVPDSLIAEHGDQLSTYPESEPALQDRTNEHFACPHLRRVSHGLIDGDVWVGLQPRRRAKMTFVEKNGVYGFARSETLPADVYMHHSQVAQRLEPGKDVSFIVVQTPRGLQARCARFAS